MKQLFRILFLLVLLGGVAGAQDAELKALKKKFDQGLQEIEHTERQKIAEAYQSYRNTVRSLSKRFKSRNSARDLQAVLNAEYRLRSGTVTPWTVKPADRPIELRSCQAAFQQSGNRALESGARRARELINAYQKALHDRQVSLTKDSRIDEAVKVKTVRDGLDRDGLLKASQARIRQRAAPPRINFKPATEKPAAPKLPTKPIAGGGHHYLLAPQKMSRQAAQDWCREKGGHLLHLNARSESEWIRKTFAPYLTLNDQEAIWLDLQRKNGDAPWLDWQGKEAVFLDWKELEPSNVHERFCRMVEQGKFRAMQDIQKYWVICEWER